MRGWRALAVALVPAALAGMSRPAAGQGYTYGNRPIDKLPKSSLARPEDTRAWDEPGPPPTWELKLHLKDLFRIAPRGRLERLGAIEARAPEGRRGPARLILRGDGEAVDWAQRADWVGTNQRLRPCWLPVRAGVRQRLVLLAEGVAVGTPAPLAEGAPPAMIELLEPRRPLAVDAGFALLPADELVAARGCSLPLRVGLPGPSPAGVFLETEVTYPGGRRAAFTRTAWSPSTCEWLSLATTSLRRPQALVRLALVCRGAETSPPRQVLAERRYRLHVVDPAPEANFGARYADLRYTAPITDGDRQRSWADYWGRSGRRDVVVSFPGQPYRLVFWRGASYVPCWALPEAWLCYEWLEAEPDFYGAVDCVEPIMDKDCRHSQTEITAGSPARTVVTWRYALTDFVGQVIRDEHAEETWTLYPDGIGTRYLRGFYRSGWHENQEFIVINRPGRRPSEALAPQAISFHNTRGERQQPVWPKPGFSLAGWRDTISVVALGAGPRPFMVTADAPTQAKVWADPYLEKPDLFNSYPHWPVTRGMPTSWLDDPAQFLRPSHSNLANLVNEPMRSTEGEKDWVWLVGMARTSRHALEAARCWLAPGTLETGRGVRAGSYSRIERAYVLTADRNPRGCEFMLIPDAHAPVVDPAFIIDPWQGSAKVHLPGAAEVKVGREKGRLIVWARGRWSGRVEVRLTSSSAPR